MTRNRRLTAVRASVRRVVRGVAASGDRIGLVARAEADDPFGDPA